MSEHSWCQNIPRDEAVRAAEDAAAADRPILPDHRELPAAVEHLRSILHGHLRDFAELLGVVGRLNERVERLFADSQGTCENPASEQPAPPFADGPKRSPAVSETGETQSRLRTERVTEGRPPEPGGGANVTRLRTERVTLEVTHGESFGVSHWSWVTILRLQSNESVRVVEEAHFDDLANMSLERDAAIRERDKAIRERDKLRGEITSVLDRSEFASTELTRLRNRVAELESAAKLAPAANADGKSNHAAPAASGAAVKSVDSELAGRLQRFNDRVEAGEVEMPRFPPRAVKAASGAAGTELVGWGVRRKGGVDAVVHRLFRSSAEASAEQYGGIVVPLYAAPQPAKGWLTEEEREAVTTMASVMERDAAYFEKCQEPDHANAGWRRAKVFRDLLARSSPPEVVLPPVYCHGGDGEPLVDLEDVRAALAAAGVTVKEVG